MRYIDARYPNSIARQQWRARIETYQAALSACSDGGIARQQWRARIETAAQYGVANSRSRIARQQWRARIETASSITYNFSDVASPVAAEPKLHVFSRGEHAYSSGSVFFPRWFLTRFLRSALCLLHTAVEVEQAVMVAALLDLIEERRWPKADNASA